MYHERKGKYFFYVTELAISNNHLGALQTIRNFLGCGRIHKNKKSFNFVIRNHNDVARVAEQLIPRIIIKKEKLEEVLAFIRGRKWLNDSPLSFTTREQLQELYLGQRLSSAAIARKLGCSKSGVCKRLKRWGITKPDPPKARNKTKKSLL